MKTRQTFLDLRKDVLDYTTTAEWDAYYARMIPWLLHADADIRAMCIERLTTCVFWAEGSGPLDQRPPLEHMVKRTKWFLSEIETAHEKYDDVIPNLLSEMRFNWPYEDAQRATNAWLEKLLKHPRDKVRADVVEGIALINSDMNDAVLARCFELLDDPSDYLRACAARCLSGLEPDETGHSEADLFALIQAKDIERPGIAGPFWSEWHFSPEHVEIDPAAWMMEILENRKGPEPEIPFNGIDFYLHEICDFSPETVQKMMKLGHVGLAVETATEHHGFIADMEPILIELGHNSDKSISDRAYLWLACHYNVVHPKASSDLIRRTNAASDRYSSIAIRYGTPPRSRDRLIIYVTETGLTDDEAWEIINAIQPASARGEPVHPFGSPFDFEVPYKVGDKYLWHFSDGTQIEFKGTDGARPLWTWISLYAPDLDQFA